MVERAITDLAGYAGTREDLASIFSYHWKSPRHMREALKLLLASYLDEGEDDECLGSNTPIDDLLYLEERSDAQLTLASNPRSNSGLLGYLARKCSDVAVLERIALNPNCPESTLIKLAEHAVAEIRAAVAENCGCSKMLMNRLTSDTHADVRYRLAENIHAGREILERLVRDENPFVASRAQETLKRLNSVVVVRKFPTTETVRLKA